MEEHGMDKMCKNASSPNHKYKCQKEKVQNKILLGESNPRSRGQQYYWYRNTNPKPIHHRAMFICGINETKMSNKCM